MDRISASAWSIVKRAMLTLHVQMVHHLSVAADREIYVRYLNTDDVNTKGGV